MTAYGLFIDTENGQHLLHAGADEEAGGRPAGIHKLHHFHKLRTISHHWHVATIISFSFEIII